MQEQKKKPIRQPQSQSRPGSEALMKPLPVYDNPEKQGTGRLAGKVAIITGGDSGIGRAVAILFAREGADLVISYLDEHDDADKVKLDVEALGQRCLLIPGDISKETFCNKLAQKAVKTFGKIDILVNNAGIHYESKTLEDITTDQLVKTFSTNVFPMFWLTKAVLPAMKKGSAVINTTSVTAYRGSPELMDYAATKGAIVSFTRSLATNLIDKGIRVNAVAPGPIWTPLIAASFDKKKVAEHGSKAHRCSEPESPWR